MNFAYYSDLIENHRIGIFALLNNESKLPSPSTMNFTLNVHESWKSSTVLSAPRDKKLTDGFSVRHFAGTVYYDTVNEFYFIIKHLHCAMT